MGGEEIKSLISGRCGVFVKPKGRVNEVAGYGVDELSGVACRCTGVRQPSGSRGVPSRQAILQEGTRSERRGRPSLEAPVTLRTQQRPGTLATCVRASPLQPRWDLHLIHQSPEALPTVPVLIAAFQVTAAGIRPTSPVTCPQERDYGPQGRGTLPRHLHCD